VGLAEVWRYLSCCIYWSDRPVGWQFWKWLYFVNYFVNLCKVNY